MSVAQLVARAKINLRLKVVGRREDGYHLLEMINCSLSLADTIEFELTQDGAVKIELDWRALGVAPAKEVFCDPERNLAARAAQSFFHSQGISCGARIKIQKCIPIGGGLGGGSGNAAAVLKHLQEIFNVSPEIILPLALQLGADIPYMLHGGLARVSGIGEVIEPLYPNKLDGCPAILVFPAFGISTASVFAELRKRPLEQAQHKFVFDADLFSMIENDLFPIAVRLEPQLAQIYQALSRNQQWMVSMSGSGSTLFVLARSELVAQELEEQVRRSVSGLPVTCLAVTLH